MGAAKGTACCVCESALTGTHRRVTQKKEYGSQNVVKVWNQEWRCNVVLHMPKLDVRMLILFHYLVHSFIYLAVCLTTVPKPLPKPSLHIVRSRASCFKWEHPLLSLRSSNSFVRLLPRLPVTSIPLFYLSFNNPLQKAVSTQNVTNPVSLPFAYFMQDIPLLLDSKQYFFISHTIGLSPYSLHITYNRTPLRFMCHF